MMSMSLGKRIQTTIEQSKMDRHKSSPLSSKINMDKSGSDLTVHKTAQRFIKIHVRLRPTAVNFTY